MITASSYSSLILFGNAVVTDAKSNLVRNNSIAFGKLRDSVSYYFEADKVVFVMSDYGKWVEDGRKPGKQPPIDKILPWVKKKGLKFRDKRGRFITHKSTAFLIARSIGKKGIKSKPFFENAYQKNLPLLEDDFVEDFANEYEKQIDELFS